MPPKATRAKSSNDAKYLFVNEDATTVLRDTRDTELDRSKQSHVQRQQSARKRHDVARAAREPASSAMSSPTAIQGLDVLTIASPDAEFSGLFSSADYFSLFDPSLADDFLGTSLESSAFGLPLLSTSQGQQRASQSVPASPLYPLEEQASTSGISRATGDVLRREPSRSRRPREDRPGERRRRGQSGSVGSILTPGDTIDPFSDTLAALVNWAPPLIQYYTTVIVPHLFIAESRVRPIQLLRHTPALHADMQFCMSEAAHMYALLAYTSARMLRYEGRLLLPASTQEQYNRVPIFFKTKALTALRQKLETGHMDRLVVQDVFRLMATALMLDDEPAAEAHFLAMAEMIRALGGLDRFDDYLKERMILLDIWAANQELSKPRFPLTWDPGPLPEGIRAKIAPPAESNACSIFTGFAACADAQLLTVELTGMLLDLVDVVHLSRHSLVGGEMTPTDFKWLVLRRSAIEYHLLSSLPTKAAESNPISECIKIASLMWIGTVLADRYKQLVSQQAQTLRRYLEKTDMDQLWLEHTDLLLWITAVGAISSIEPEDARWFRKGASRAAEKIDLTTLDQFEQVMFCFFYITELQRETIIQLLPLLLEAPEGKRGSPQEPPHHS